MDFWTCWYFFVSYGWQIFDFSQIFSRSDWQLSCFTLSRATVAKNCIQGRTTIVCGTTFFTLFQMKVYFTISPSLRRHARTAASVNTVCTRVNPLSASPPLCLRSKRDDRTCVSFNSLSACGSSLLECLGSSTDHGTKKSNRYCPKNSRILRTYPITCLCASVRSAKRGHGQMFMLSNC